MFTRRPRRVVLALLALASAAFVPVALHAQSSGVGTISGTVLDSTGAVVQNATVEITDTYTGASRTVTTTESGDYAAPFLQPGHYEVVVSAAGFGRNDHKDLVLTVGQVLTVDASLTTGGATTEVLVTSQPNIIDTD